MKKPRRKLHYNGKAFRMKPPRPVCNQKRRGWNLTPRIDDVTCRSCRAFLKRNPVLRAGTKFVFAQSVNVFVPPLENPFDND